MKLIYIEWCDAITINDDRAWNTLKECKEMGANENWVTIEVGFILEETKEYILFANKKSKHNDSYGGVFKIPKTWIRKRIDLTKHIK